MSNKNQNRSLLDTQRNTSNAGYDEFLGSVKGNYADTIKNSNALRSQIQEKYTNSNNFMPAGMSPNANGWFNLPPGSSAAGGNYGSARTGFEDFSKTGGINRADFAPALDSYKNFITSGGLGEEDKNALRARAGSAIPSFYNAYKNSAKRRANVQGGYAPGFDSQMAELGRESARQGFEANRQVEGDIVDKVQQGKEFGTSGYGTLMSDVAGKEQSGRLAGMHGLTDIAGLEQANNQFNAGQNNQMQMSLADMYQRGGITSAAGLKDLYGTAPGDVGQMYQNWLAGMGGRNQNELANLGLRSNIKGTDWTKWLGLLAGGGGGFGNPGGFGNYINPTVVGKGKKQAKGGIYDSEGNYLGE